MSAEIKEGGDFGDALAKDAKKAAGEIADLAVEGTEGLLQGTGYLLGLLRAEVEKLRTELDALHKRIEAHNAGSPWRI